MSIEPITIPMSIETNDVTIESTFDARIEVVEGGSITVESLSVNTNGTITAPTGKAYSPVVVNVPNSYTNSDEGKVVKNGALASQTSTTKSANGTYDTTTNNQVTVAVPASAVDTGTKNITSNGNNQDVVGYAAVNVSVPNSYSASDEGKVVSSGALVSQTSDTVTANDTYDTTLINSLTVNVSGGGSGIEIGIQNTTIPNILNMFYALEQGTAKTGEFTLSQAIPNSEVEIFDTTLATVHGIFIADESQDTINTANTPENALYALCFNPTSEGTCDYAYTKLTKAMDQTNTNSVTGAFLPRATYRVSGGKLYCTGNFNRNDTYTPFHSSHTYRWVAW